MKIPKGKKVYVAGKVYKSGDEIPDKEIPKGLKKPEKTKPGTQKDK